MLPQAATKAAVPFGARVSSGDLCGIAAKAPTEAGAETGGSAPTRLTVKQTSKKRVTDEVENLAAATFAAVQLTA